MSKGDEKIEAKLNYYKNLKPKTGVFQTAVMDPSQQIIQSAHEKNLQFQAE